MVQVRRKLFVFQEQAENRAIEKALRRFLAKAEEPFRSGRIDPISLGYELRKVGRYPGGSGEIISTRWEESRWGMESSSLGYAWVRVQGLLYLAAVHTWLVRGAPFPFGAEGLPGEARRFLMEELSRRGVPMPPREVRVGNVVFGGYPFDPGPRWLSPAEDPGIRLELKPVRLPWDFLTYTQFVAERLKELLPGESAGRVLEAMEGRASGEAVLSTILLGKL